MFARQRNARWYDSDVNAGNNKGHTAIMIAAATGVCHPLSLALCLAFALSLSPCLSLSQSLSLYLPLACVHEHTHTRTNTLSLSLSLTHTHTHLSSVAHAHSFVFLSLFLSSSLALIRTFALSLSLAGSEKNEKEAIAIIKQLVSKVCFRVNREDLDRLIKSRPENGSGSRPDSGLDWPICSKWFSVLKPEKQNSILALTGSCVPSWLDSG